MDLLYLNESNMVEAGVLDMEKCINTMHDVFRLLYLGDYRMGGEGANEHGIKVTFPTASKIEGMPIDGPDRRFAAMPAYLGGRFHSFGIKTYGSNQQNKEIGLPRSFLMMSLMDVDTGVPKAYMSANYLSTVRTGAVVGLGCRYLAPLDSNVLAIVGPGKIGIQSVRAILLERKINVIKIFGLCTDDIENFIEILSADNEHIRFVICDSIEQACKDSDIVLFSNSNASVFKDNPMIKKRYVKEGALVISTSALLLDEDIINNMDNNIFVADNYQMYDAWGRNQNLPAQENVSSLLGMCFFDSVIKGIIKREDVIGFSEIIYKNSFVRDNSKQTIYFAVGGMPIEDVAWACECYDNAVRYHIGSKLPL